MATATPDPASSAAVPAAQPASTVPATDEAATIGAANDGERFYLQVAALGSAASARELQARLQSELDSPVRIDSGSRLHRVQVGPVADRLALEVLRSQLRRAGFAQSFAVTAND